MYVWIYLYTLVSLCTVYSEELIMARGYAQCASYRRLAKGRYPFHTHHTCVLHVYVRVMEPTRVCMEGACAQDSPGITQLSLVSNILLLQHNFSRYIFNKIPIYSIKS